MKSVNNLTGPSLTDNLSCYKKKLKILHSFYSNCVYLSDSSEEKSYQRKVWFSRSSLNTLNSGPELIGPI